MKLVFMGTPEYAVPSLQALLNAGHEIACVYAQPARRSGRGQETRSAPVARVAAQAELSVRTPVSFKGVEELEVFAGHHVDAAVTVAYGLLLPKAVLSAPRLGCINAHASLLPRWRGAAPIQRAIMAGDTRSGVTIMQMDEGLDTGPILFQQEIPITASTTAGMLHDDLAALSATMLVETLRAYEAGQVNATAQSDDGKTYARKIDKAESQIDWAWAAVDVERLVRAMAPAPGTWFSHDGQRIKILQAEIVAMPRGPESVVPGTVVDDALNIACGEDTCLRPLILQRAGKAPVATSDFLRGYSLTPGTRLSCRDTS